jgi:hypothetical protein
MLCKAAQPPAGQESAFSPERISSQPCSPDGFTIRRKTGHWAVSFRFGQYHRRHDGNEQKGNDLFLHVFSPLGLYVDETGQPADCYF